MSTPPTTNACDPRNSLKVRTYLANGTTGIAGVAVHDTQTGPAAKSPKSYEQIG